MLGFSGARREVSQPVLDHLVKPQPIISFKPALRLMAILRPMIRFMLIATGASNLEITDIDSPEYKTLATAVIGLSQKLAHMIVRDGEVRPIHQH